MARKVGAPLQPELAIGAVTRFGEVWNQEVIDSLQLSRTEVAAALAQAERELGKREKRLRAARPAQPIVGHSILLVDDGWATGATAAAAVQGLLRAGAATDAVERLRAMGAETVVLVTPTNPRALGEFYRLFFPITTDACIELLIADGPRTPRSRLRNPSST